MNSLKLENLSPIVDSLNIREAGVGGARELKSTESVTGPAGIESPGSAGSFSEMLGQSIDKVNDMQIQADDAIKQLVSGRTKNIHETMLSIERADLSLKLMMQVRNKVIDAYREIMRMQV